MAEILDQIRVIIEQIVTTLGYPGISLVMFTENIFPPIPSELVMPFAGFLVADGKYSLPGIIFAGTLGSVIGAVVLYYIGVWADEPIVRAFLRRWGRYFMVSEDDLDRVLTLFDRYGSIIVFFGRVIPIVRSLISLPAGMNRMPLPRFLVFTTLGATIWTSLLSIGGMILGENWEQIMEYVSQYEKVVLVVLVLAVLAFVVLRIRERRAGRNKISTVNRPASEQLD